ncbi:MAG TPA: hypothetical protein VMF86_03730 [Stellaceae bacterium]|nr:hypothetical protein [Stellaceae bacterium]
MEQILFLKNADDPMLATPFRDMVRTQVSNGADTGIARSNRFQFKLDFLRVQPKNGVGTVSTPIRRAREIEQVHQPVFTHIVLGNPPASHEPPA